MPSKTQRSGQIALRREKKNMKKQKTTHPCAHAPKNSGRTSLGTINKLGLVVFYYFAMNRGRVGESIKRRDAATLFIWPGLWSTIRLVYYFFLYFGLRVKSPLARATRVDMFPLWDMATPGARCDLPLIGRTYVHNVEYELLHATIRGRRGNTETRRVWNRANANGRARLMCKA